MIYAENILICITVPLLISILFLRGKTRLLTVFFLLGMGICLLAAYISGFAGLVGGLGENDTAVFLSPVIEECMKCLPMFFYFFLMNPGGEELFLCAVGTGAGFSLFENVCYMLTAGADRLSFILIRSFAVGTMHIVSMLAIALGLSFAIRLKAVTAASVIGAVALAMTFHGLYNLLVSEPGISAEIGYALPLLTAILMHAIYVRMRDEGAKGAEKQ